MSGKNSSYTHFNIIIDILCIVRLIRYSYKTVEWVLFIHINSKHMNCHELSCCRRNRENGELTAKSYYKKNISTVLTEFCALNSR